MKWDVYKRVTRLDKPIGILLLWYPTAWALWLANRGGLSLKLFSLFFIGTVLMRSAGCVINDIADRDIDKHVSRTKLRPITSNEISVKEAFFLLATLLFAAFLILLYLPWGCFYLAIIALAVIFIYPFCKRFISAPQVVLGLAFSMGIPMAYVASGTSFDADMWLLCSLNFAWIVAYDTMYAMADKEDDLKIGVKSTAIYFADYDRLIIGLLLLVLHALWLAWALINQVNVLFYPVWAIASFVLIHQQKLISQRIPQDCFKAFIVSNYYGAFMWLAVALATSS
ncbi:4-hydroxybenzoate-octaprenyltransferase [Legionella shakespearei DSM 23087]|uniref:4-hydroxybenzoate octaprenyltransferase n=2 Tax=Legionella shakespearei TaxID=45075 RepID=A0A0W0YUH7_9GAMM|nr:4-hydroxybenzoate-octaprenyltransferase [Legionella shakespearei DSM 23087]